MVSTCPKRSCFHQSVSAWNGPKSIVLEQVSRTWATHVFWIQLSSVFHTLHLLPTICYPESIPKHVGLNTFCCIHLMHIFDILWFILMLYFPIKVMSPDFACCVPCRITSSRCSLIRGMLLNPLACCMNLNVSTHFLINENKILLRFGSKWIKKFNVFATIRFRDCKAFPVWESRGCPRVLAVYSRCYAKVLSAVQ